MSVNAAQVDQSSLEPIYDSLAEGYGASQTIPIRAAVDDYSVFQYINVDGKSVLDLSCKDGHFARLFLKEGATKVVGFAPSKHLINIAVNLKSKGDKETYFLGDIFSIGSAVGEFDYVTAIFLFHFSDSVSKLEEMFEIAFQRLKPGGELLAINENISLANPNVKKGYYHKYNYETVFRQPINEGSIVDVKMFNEDGSTVSFSGYHYSFDTYKKAAKKAGFETLEILPLFVSPEAVEQRGEVYWQDFLNKPNTAILLARKPL